MLIYPFDFEGNRRRRGLSQAVKFADAFGRLDAPDNETFPIYDNESLLDVYQRING